LSDGWLGFFGGVLASLVAALIASVSQRQIEYKRRKDQARLDVYFHLLDLHNWYFWVASAELHGEQPSDEALHECRKLTYQLNDKLRSFEDVEHLDEILLVLFSESVPSANDRANKISELVEKYGKLVSPRYRSTLQLIGYRNLLRHGPGKTPSSNAPGSWQYHR
jgi:hypothetical protein